MESFLAQVSSAPMFLVAGIPVLFIFLLCVVYLVKSYRAGVAMGIDQRKLKRAVTSSVTFSLLPSVAILLGVIALSGSLGLPLSWLRLSVVGALHYEGNVADIAARACGLAGGLGSAVLTNDQFVTIALVMTAGIFTGVPLSIFVLKPYLKKLSKKPKAEETAAADGAAPEKKKGFGDVLFTAMFIGLVSAYIGSYLGEWTGNGNWMPLFVAAVSAVCMGVFEYFARVKKAAWLDNFSMALSMLVGMAAAVLAGAL